MLDNRSQVNFVSQGEGEPVLLIHGLAASLGDWSELMPDLVSTGYQVHALDLLGHGDSFKPDTPSGYTMENVYNHLAGWFDGLKLSSPVFLVGHSLGGYLSLLLGLRNPLWVRGIVLIDPLYSLEHLSPVLSLMNHRIAWGEKAMRAAPEWLIQTALGLEPVEAAHYTPEARRRIANDCKHALRMCYTSSSISRI